MIWTSDKMMARIREIMRDKGFSYERAFTLMLAEVKRGDLPKP